MIINTNIVVAVIFLAVLVFFLVYKKFFVQKKSNPVSEESSPLISTYSNSRKNDDKKLTLKEKVELSWKFLYEITEIIINKFSKEDVEVVNKCGRLLLDNGGKYEHIVDLALQRPIRSHTQAVEQTQSKGATLGV